MIKRTQKYLLLHYPALWNIRIVPMLLILIGVHLIFFGIGYQSNDTVFNDKHYYYSIGNDLGLLYFVSVLVGILILIGWMVYYSRNNAFKTFYPRKTYQLYIEWVLILIITTGISLLPCTLTEGYTTKWRSAASLNETKKAIETLHKAEILIPSDKDYFRYESEYDRPIPIPSGMILSADTLDLNLYYTEYNYDSGILIKGYTGPSLLFGKDRYYYSYYYSKNTDYVDDLELMKIKRQERVKEWLKAGSKDSIYTVMQEFLKLQNKHGFNVNITPEKWMERIYKPPFFPVNNNTAINKYEPENYDLYRSNNLTTSVEEVVVDPDQYVDYDHISPYAIPYLQYNELYAGYTQILKYYQYENDIEWIMLVCLCIALALSIFIYSFRVTGGKQWLIAFISLGVLIFAVVLVGVAMLESAGYRSEEIIIMILLLFWITLFIALLARIINKIMEKSNKGRSGVYMNILVWLVPCLVPLLFLTVLAHSEYTDKDYFKPEENDVMNMLWLNILFTIIIMWFISMLVRRWKSIADE